MPKDEKKELGKGTRRVLTSRIREMKKRVKDKESLLFAEKNIRESTEWENSLEGILYDLQPWGAVMVEDEKTTLAIAKTLMRLPYKVRRNVLEEVTFIFTSAWGTGLTLHFQKLINKKDFKQFRIGEQYHAEVIVPAIILNLPEGTAEAERMDTIAHEIAHFILGHFHAGGELIRKGQRERTGEREADDLTEKWGFRRCYKSYSVSKGLQPNYQYQKGGD